jgi:hypothetical protein
MRKPRAAAQASEVFAACMPYGAKLSYLLPLRTQLMSLYTPSSNIPSTGIATMRRVMNSMSSRSSSVTEYVSAATISSEMFTSQPPFDRDPEVQAVVVRLAVDEASEDLDLGLAEQLVPSPSHRPQKAVHHMERFLSLDVDDFQVVLLNEDNLVSVTLRVSYLLGFAGVNAPSRKARLQLFGVDQSAPSCGIGRMAG